MTDHGVNYRQEIISYLKKALILCSIGVLLNIVPAAIAGYFKAPVWIDTIGTMLVAILGGYVPGIFVGFVTNVINSFTVEFSSIYYSVINVIIAILSTFFYSTGALKRVKTLIPFILVIPLLCACFDEILPFVLIGLEDLPFWQNLLSEFIDKTIVIAIVLLVLRYIPKDKIGAFHLRLWQQKPLTREEEKLVKNMDCRILSVRTKIMIIIIGSMLLISVTATSISGVLYHNYMITDYTKLAYKVAQEATNVVDPNKIGDFVVSGSSTPEYRKTERDLKLLKQSIPYLEYLYVYKILKDGCMVIFDVDPDGGESPGAVIPFDESFQPYIEQLQAGEKIEPIISNDRYGWLLTVYVPLKDQSGKTISYIGADVRMESVLENEISFLVKLIFCFLGFLIVILFSIIWFVDYSMIYPVNSIALRTSEFAFSSNTSIDQSIAKIKALDIHTGDEFERLYHIFLKMIDDSRDYTVQIQHQKDRIAKMQHSMIVVLADMVESRDENTGMHIHKTAEYVRIILEKMKEMGLHKDFINDKYISNVVNSAPLHDIGKIKIPDQILNKPGKLTPEEFEIMKSHAAAGRDIIEKVIRQVPDSSFLKEAKAIAAYHHEKWDGTGYPCGLSKEEIPFSARVMAIADVFDALVSKRVYKPEMPLIKAFSIIREGAGHHFDPEIVNVFFAAQDQIVEAKEKFDHMHEEPLEG